MAHDVFISYSSRDKTAADAASAVLESSGVRCWIAPRDISPGRDWGEAILDGISGSRVFLLMFSEAANASPQVRREVERAVNRGIAIIPFRIEDVKPGKSLEYFISTPHWLDAFTPPLQAHLDRLVPAVRALLGVSEAGLGAAATPPPAPSGSRFLDASGGQSSWERRPPPDPVPPSTSAPEPAPAVGEEEEATDDKVAVSVLFGSLLVIFFLSLLTGLRLSTSLDARADRALAAGRVDEAVQLSKQASDQRRSARSDLRLAQLYAYGEKVPTDLIQARTYIDRGLKIDNKDADFVTLGKITMASELVGVYATDPECKDGRIRIAADLPQLKLEIYGKIRASESITDYKDATLVATDLDGESSFYKLDGARLTRTHAAQETEFQRCAPRAVVG